MTTVGFSATKHVLDLFGSVVPSSRLLWVSFIYRIMALNTGNKCEVYFSYYPVFLSFKENCNFETMGASSADKSKKWRLFKEPFGLQNS